MPALCCLLALSSVAGCAHFRADEETVVVCGRGFAKDEEWSRVSMQDPEPRALRKHFKAVSADAPIPTSRATTMWFRKGDGQEFASCAKYGCEEGQCFWRVQLYARDGAGWRLAPQYHLAARKKP